MSYGFCMRLAAVTMLFAVASLSPAHAYTQTLVWSTGSNVVEAPSFNGATADTCLNGTIGTSTSIAHSGNYSWYFHGQSNARSGMKACREYRMLSLIKSPYSDFQPITSFHFVMWIYIPKVTLKAWVSLATFGTGDQMPFTIDSSPSGQLQLFIGVMNGMIIHQNLVSSPARIPFNQWFSLSVDASGLGTSNSQITVYQNGRTIIGYQGPLLNGPLQYAHFGLYMSNNQPSLTIYNDDMSLWALG